MKRTGMKTKMIKSTCLPLYLIQFSPFHVSHFPTSFEITVAPYAQMPVTYSLLKKRISTKQQIYISTTKNQRNNQTFSVTPHVLVPNTQSTSRSPAVNAFCQDPEEIIAKHQRYRSTDWPLYMLSAKEDLSPPPLARQLPWQRSLQLTLGVLTALNELVYVK